MIPYRIEGEVHVYTKLQIDTYGWPDYDNYYVVDVDVEYVMNYQDEIDRKMRPIHRYKRVERFTFILAQLLQLKGVVPREIISLCSDCKSWDDIRNVLKQCGKRRYYNCIPTIMKTIGVESPIIFNVTSMIFRDLIEDFLKFQYEYSRKNISRKYFPSLRYIALKILENNGAKISIPYLRTRRITIKTDEIWNSIMY